MREPVSILQHYWGYPAFRPLQEDIIRSVLDGHDTLALMPTGGGKSICFQVPALAKEGVCIVISPLIALMKDQVQQLKKRNIAAEAIYSGMSYRDIDRIFDNAVHGACKLLYLSPERLTTEIALARIPRMKVNLLAVDEAHCISQWGYDFRPPYLEIGEFRKWLPEVPVLALTATATPVVVTDIQEKLAFEKGKVFTKSFRRENLTYVVLRDEDKMNKMVDIFSKVPGSGIVYVRSRRKTQEIAHELNRQGIPTAYYHAGMSSTERSAVQEDWMKGKARIIAATNAFGMGIDKPDVRAVVHIELPDSLEAYFQEAGRAGRDGQRSYAALLYVENDRDQLLSRLESSYPAISEIKRVYQALGSYFQLAVGSGLNDSFNFDLDTFVRTYQLGKYKTYACLQILEREGWIALSDAVFIPARVQVVTSKEQLYDYQLRHPKMDTLLKLLLRSYQGTFVHAVNIDEFKLAHQLKITRSKLISMMRKLATDGIIEYEVMRDQPQLSFLRARVSNDHFYMDHYQYKFLKKRQEERVQAAIQYAETSICRSRQLLAYFGEHTQEVCGKCDVCTGRYDTELTDQAFVKLQSKIIALLETAVEYDTRSLIEAFTPAQREKALRVLQYLTDENILTLHNDILTINR